MVTAFPASLLVHPPAMESFLSDACNNGTATLSDMLRLGNFGIGTFDNGGGEMILFAGIPYSHPEPDRSVPLRDFTAGVQFAMVTRFQRDRTVTLHSITDYQDFERKLDKNLRNLSHNYAVLLRGQFSHLTLECPRKKSLSLQNVEGMLVGFRITSDHPAAAGRPGYHFHGMAVGGYGGHVSDMGILTAQADIQRLGALEVFNP